MIPVDIVTINGSARLTTLMSFKMAAAKKLPNLEKAT